MEFRLDLSIQDLAEINLGEKIYVYNEDEGGSLYLEPEDYLQDYLRCIVYGIKVENGKYYVKDGASYTVGDVVYVNGSKKGWYKITKTDLK